jgi:hypothetical protein
MNANCAEAADFDTDRMAVLIAMCAAYEDLLCVCASQQRFVDVLCGLQAAIVPYAALLHTQSAQVEVPQKIEGLQRSHLPLSTVRPHGSVSFVEHKSGVRAAHIAC